MEVRERVKRSDSKGLEQLLVAHAGNVPSQFGALSTGGFRLARETKILQVFARRLAAGSCGSAAGSFAAALAPAERTDDAVGMPGGIDHINAVIQRELLRRRFDEVSAVEAARWLDAAGALNDSPSRPGLPLRNLLRAGEIDGAVQRPPSAYGRWFI